MPTPPPVTFAQHVHLARYITSDATGGFSAVGLAAHDRWLEERDGAPSIPDLGIAVVVTTTSWYPELATGRVAVDLVEPSGRTASLADIDGATAFGNGTEDQAYRVAFAIQHHDVPTEGPGLHRLRITTSLPAPDGSPTKTLVTQLDLPVHPPVDPDAVPPTSGEPPAPGAQGYL